MAMTMEFFDYGEPVSIDVPVARRRHARSADVLGGLGGLRRGGVVIERTIDVAGHGGSVYARGGRGGRGRSAAAAGPRLHRGQGGLHRLARPAGRARLARGRAATSAATAAAASRPTRRPTRSTSSPPTCSACSTRSAGPTRSPSVTRWAAWSLQTAALRAPERFEALVLMDTSHRGLRVDPGLVELGVAIARAEGIAAVMAAQDALGPRATRSAPPAHERLLATRPGYQEFGDRKMLASSPAMYAAMLQAITDGGGVDRLPELSGDRRCPPSWSWATRTSRS